MTETQRKTPDREKVIRQWEGHIDQIKQGNMRRPITTNLIYDTLALLREQKAMEQCLKTKCVVCPHCANCDVDENGLLKRQEPVIVRCKNCRHYDIECITDSCGWCNRRNFGTNDEWYCADGEVEYAAN